MAASNVKLVDPASPTKALEAARAGRFSALGDFDEHLEDVTVDFLRNSAITV